MAEDKDIIGSLWAAWERNAPPGADRQDAFRAGFEAGMSRVLFASGGQIPKPQLTHDQA